MFCISTMKKEQTSCMMKMINDIGVTAIESASST
jgi:hypothetical protein